jgi:hypothetical protein
MSTHPLILNKVGKELELIFEGEYDEAVSSDNGSEHAEYTETELTEHCE